MKIARSLRSILAVCLALSLVAAACSKETVDPGDPVAFCDLLRQGIGLGNSTDGLVDLEAVAPPEIRTQVRELANSARSLDDIADTELEELFSAAFDPEAIEARAALNQYAIDQCGSGIDTDGTTEASTFENEIAARNDVQTYLNDNFGSSDWVDGIAIEAIFAFGVLDSVEAQFKRAPKNTDESLEACNALSVYLYALQSGSGSVSVNHGDDVLASRTDPEGLCIQP